MTTSNSTRERRDWTLLIFIIPIGIIFMLIAGQVAIRLVPIWSINAGMQSNLDPNNLPMQQSGLIQPILPAILTPLGWFDTFLTPGAGTGDDVVFPPFIIFEPTITPVVTTPPPTVVVTPSPTIPVTTSPTVVVTPSATRTPRPTNEPTSNPPPVAPISTLPANATQVPAPTDIVGPPDLSIYNLQDGEYMVIDLGLNPIIVDGSSDYDLRYYEMYNLVCDGVCMDNIIIGISNDPAILTDPATAYYEVFNWGAGGADMNSNVGDVAGAEADNQAIPSSELYGTIPLFETGIEIDVDGASSDPPVGSYQYIVILSPEGGSSGDAADIDAIEVIPPPP